MIVHRTEAGVADGIGTSLSAVAGAALEEPGWTVAAERDALFLVIDEGPGPAGSADGVLWCALADRYATRLGAMPALSRVGHTTSNDAGREGS